jgi:hypothetical protein
MSITRTAIPKEGQKPSIRKQDEYFRVQCMALLALAHVPHRSHYRKWCCELIAGELEKKRYEQMRKWLIQFHLNKAV